MTRFALIGAGNIGRVHLENLRSLRGCRVSGVYDPNPAPVLAGEKKYASLDEPLGDETVDAIVIATPSSSHSAIAVAAIERGKHVFVEKPLAGTLEDAQAIVDAAARRPELAVQAGFCERFNVNYLEAKRAVSAGLLGNLAAIHTSRLAPFAFSDPRWELGVLDTAVHNLDLILWLKGIAPTRVLARGATVYSGSAIPHSVTTTLSFADGSMAVDHIAWVRDEGYPLNQCARSRMFLQGSEGFFEVDLTDRPSGIRTAAGYRKIDSVILGAAEYAGCLKLQFEYFLRAIEDGAPVLAPPADALLAERVALAALESLRSGREVLLAP